jgi:hypothetical protein
MVTYYTVVRYVPDPVADERINIGVMVWGDGRIRSRFLSNWQRARHFGIPDVSFIRDFARRMADADSDQLVLPDGIGIQRFNEPALERAIDTWAGAIQFSTKWASLRDPDTVLKDASERFLRLRADTLGRLRGRQSAAKLTQRTVEEALQARVGDRDARHFIRKNYSLPGKLEDHKVDVGVVNGAPHLAAQGLSFEIQDLADMRYHYTETVYAVTDLKERLPDLSFGVVLYPPPSGAASATVTLYKKAVRVLPNAGAVLVEEGEAAEWAREAIGKIPDEALGTLR